jgi:hypothetical protein
VGQLKQYTGRIETADPQVRRASPVDANLAASVFHGGDVIQRHSEPASPVAGEKRV